MHFLSTLALSCLAFTVAGAVPLQKRDDVGDASNPVDDLLTNVEGGVEGFGTFVTGDSDKLKTRDLDVADTLGGTVDSVGGVLNGVEGQDLKTRDVDAVDTLGETVNRVDGETVERVDGVLETRDIEAVDALGETVENVDGVINARQA